MRICLYLLSEQEMLEYGLTWLVIIISLLTRIFIPITVTLRLNLYLGSLHH